MTEHERRPEREQGAYDPSEDPDTDPPAPAEDAQDADESSDDDEASAQER